MNRNKKIKIPVSSKSSTKQSSYKSVQDDSLRYDTLKLDTLEYDGTLYDPLTAHNNTLDTPTQNVENGTQHQIEPFELTDADIETINPNLLNTKQLLGLYYLLQNSTIRIQVKFYEKYPYLKGVLAKLVVNNPNYGHELPIIRLTPEELAKKLETMLSSGNVKPEIAIQAHKLIMNNLTNSEQRADFYIRYARLTNIIERNLPVEYIIQNTSGYEVGYEISDSELDKAILKVNEAGDTELFTILYSVRYQEANEIAQYTDNKDYAVLFAIALFKLPIIKIGRFLGTQMKNDSNSFMNIEEFTVARQENQLPKGGTKPKENLTLKGNKLGKLEKDMGGHIYGFNFGEFNEEDVMEANIDREKHQSSIKFSSLPLKAINYNADTFSLRTGQVIGKSLSIDYRRLSGSFDEKIVNANIEIKAESLKINNLRFIVDNVTYAIGSLSVTDFKMDVFKKVYSHEAEFTYEFLMNLFSNQIPTALIYLTNALLQLKQHINAGTTEEQEAINSAFSRELASDVSDTTHFHMEYGKMHISNFVTIGKSIEIIKEIRSEDKSDKNEKSTITIQSDNSMLSSDELLQLENERKQLLELRARLYKIYEEKTLKKQEGKFAFEIEQLTSRIAELERSILPLVKKQMFTTSSDLKGIKIKDDNYLKNSKQNLLGQEKSISSAPEEEYFSPGDIHIDSTSSSTGIGSSTITLKEMKISGPVIYSDKTNILSALEYLVVKNATATFSYLPGEGKNNHRTINKIYLHIPETFAKGVELCLNDKQITLPPDKELKISGMFLAMEGSEWLKAGLSDTNLSGLEVANLIQNTRLLHLENLQIENLGDEGIAYYVENFGMDLTVLKGTGKERRASDLKFTTKGISGTHKEKDGVSYDTIYLPYDIKIPGLNLRLTDKNIIAPNYKDENRMAKISGINASVEYKYKEDGNLDYFKLHALDIASITAYGLKVTDSKGKSILNTPENEESSFSGISVSGFNLTLKDKNLSITPENEGAYAGIQNYYIPQLSFLAAEKYITLNNLMSVGENAGVSLTQKPGANPIVDITGIKIGDIPLPYINKQLGGMSIEAPLNKDYVSKLTDVREVSIKMEMDNAYNIKKIIVNKITADAEVYGLKLKSGNTTSLNLPPHVAATITGITITDLVLNKASAKSKLELQKANLQAQSFEIAEVKAAIADLFKGDLNVSTGLISGSFDKGDIKVSITNPNANLLNGSAEIGKEGNTRNLYTPNGEFVKAERIDVSMTAKGDLTTEIINPVLASLEIEGQKERIQNIYNGLGEYFAKADKIVIKQLKGQNNSYEIHNPVVAPLSIEGKSFGVANMENYTLELGGRINGVMKIKEINNEWIIEGGDEVIMENIKLVTTLKDTPKEKFEDFSEEEQEKQVNEITALENNLYKSSGKFGFLDAAQSGTIKLTMFDKTVDIEIESIKNKDNEIEHGFIDLAKAIEEIESIMEGKVKKENKDLEVTEHTSIIFDEMEAQKEGNNYVIEFSWGDIDGPILVPDYDMNVKKNEDGEEMVRLSAFIDYQINKPTVKKEPDEDVEKELARWENEKLMNLKFALTNIQINPSLLRSEQIMGVLAPLNLTNPFIINLMGQINESFDHGGMNLGSSIVLPNFNYYLKNDKSSYISGAGLTAINSKFNFDINEEDSSKINLHLNLSKLVINKLIIKVKK